MEQVERLVLFYSNRRKDMGGDVGMPADLLVW